MTFSDPSNIESGSEPLLSPGIASSDILDAAFAALPDALFVFDQDRLLSRFNSAATLLQGLGNPPLAGRRCCEMFWRVEESKISPI